MHDVIIFAGPTLKPPEIESVLDADIRPPVARGDVLEAALEKPAAIGIVDGYFARVPSVWHKEILWAMSQGIHVFGAASMGALRAVELESFGMRGVGFVFEQYKNGILTDDDEVAVIHASEEQGYRALSEAMVNVRCTLRAAEHAGVISHSARNAFEDILKAQPYSDRSYPTLVSLAEKDTALVNEIVAFRMWLRKGRVDQKRDDALLMVRHIGDMQRAGWTPKQVHYRFAHTDAWEALRNDVVKRRRLSSNPSGPGILERHILDELLVTRRLARVYDGALTRALCIELAQRAGAKVNTRAVESLVDEFRREHSLLRPEQFDSWLHSEKLADGEIVQFFQNEAEIRRIRAAFAMAMRSQLLDYLRTTSELGALTGRAEAKQRELAARGTNSIIPLNDGVLDSELWRWYFLEYLDEDVPTDMESYANSQRTTVDELRSAVMREYLFVHNRPMVPSDGRTVRHGADARNFGCVR